jgi:hypothetical protein
MFARARPTVKPLYLSQFMSTRASAWAHITNTQLREVPSARKACQRCVAALFCVS